MKEIVFLSLFGVILITVIALIVKFKKKRNNLVLALAIVFTSLLGSIYYVSQSPEISAKKGENTENYLINMAGKVTSWGELQIYSPESIYTKSYKPGESVFLDFQSFFYTCTNDGGTGFQITRVPNSNAWHSIKTTNIDNLNSLKSQAINYSGPTSAYVYAENGGSERRWTKSSTFKDEITLPTEPGIYMIPVKFQYGHSYQKFTSKVIYDPLGLGQLQIKDPTSAMIILKENGYTNYQHYLSFNKQIGYAEAVAKEIKFTSKRGENSKVYGVPVCVEGGGYCPTEKVGALTCSTDDSKKYRTGDSVVFTANLENPVNPQDIKYWWPNTPAKDQGTTTNTYTTKFLTPGQKEITILAKSAQTSYGPSTCKVMIEPPAEVSCQVSTQNAVVKETQVNYDAKILAGLKVKSYQWFVGDNVSNKLIIPGETKSTYQKTFNSISEETSRIIEITKQDNSKAYGVCPVINANCGTKPTTGETECVSDMRKQYVCQDSGWELQELSCLPTNPPGTDDPSELETNFKKFEFNPNTTNTEEKCTLELDIENVSSCTLVNRADEKFTITPTSGNNIKTSAQYSIGTYSLSCLQIDPLLEKVDFPATRSCYSNADLREN